MCFGVALAEVCFGTFLFVAASGRKYVLVPIFPVSIVAASGRNLFWFLLFQQLRHCIWWVFCFGSYFSSLYVAASGGKFVLVPIFQRLLWYYLAGILFLVPIFQHQFHMFLNSLVLIAFIFMSGTFHWVLVTLMALVFLMVILAAFSPRVSKKDLVCLHLDYSLLIS